MEDIEATAPTGEWKAGRGVIEVPLNRAMVEFMASSFTELEKAWNTAKKVAELMSLLHEAGWGADDKTWTPARAQNRSVEFTNRQRAIDLDDTHQLRLQASFSSTGKLSLRFHPWYR